MMKINKKEKATVYTYVQFPGENNSREIRVKSVRSQIIPLWWLTIRGDIFTIKVGIIKYKRKEREREREREKKNGLCIVLLFTLVFVFLDFFGIRCSRSLSLQRRIEHGRIGDFFLTT